MTSLVVLLIIIYIFWLLNWNILVLIPSSIDGQQYYVNNLKDKHLASDMLADLRNKLKMLVDNLDENNAYYRRLKNRFGSIVFVENPVLSPSKTMTSYSINKGEKIVLCMRDPKSLKLHESNIILYVAIHEISHIACPEIGHTQLFVQIFSDILKEAIKLNIYRDDNYKVNPTEYCGIVISERII